MKKDNNNDNKNNNINNEGHFGGTVGYKNPPKNGQFKPGQSGNKKGKPKKEQDQICDIVKKVIFTARKAMVNGKKVDLNYMEMAMMKMCESAAKGNIQATRLMLSISEDSGFFAQKLEYIPIYVPTKRELKAMDPRFNGEDDDL